MRPLDETDRRILETLREDGRAPWATLARTVGVPDSTAYRRTSALFAEGRIRVGVLPIAPLDAVRLYELRLRCRPGRQREVARALAARKDIRWVAVVTGDYGVAAELVVPAGVDPAGIIFDDIEQGDENILGSQSSVLLHSFKLPGNLSHGFVFDPELDLRVLDDAERATLAALRDDGRRNYASVAAEVGMSESTVRRRIQAMLKTDAAAVVTVVHPPSLGFEHEAIIRLDVLPEHLESVAGRLAAHAGVRYLAAVFGETALVCEIAMRTPSETYELLNDVIGKARGVTRMTVEVELIVLKRAFLETPWTQDAPVDVPTAATPAPR